MENLTKVVVIYGGSSAEREISLISGAAVQNSLKEEGIQSDLLDFISLQKLPSLKEYDIAFIALHGYEGEGASKTQVFIVSAILRTYRYFYSLMIYKVR